MRRTEVSIRHKIKAPDGNQAHIKNIQHDYNTKGVKMKVTVYAYGRKLEPNEPIIIPKNHRFYDIWNGIANEMLDKEEEVA